MAAQLVGNLQSGDSEATGHTPPPPSPGIFLHPIGASQVLPNQASSLLHLPVWKIAGGCAVCCVED